MRRTLWFSVGVFVAFCLFWPGSAAAETWTTWHDYTKAHTGVTCGIYSGGSRLVAEGSPVIGSGSSYNNGYRRSSGVDVIGGLFTTASNTYYRATQTTTICRVERSTDYSPPPTEPATCQNDVKDGDEVGYDCGGSCLAECSAYCPSNEYAVYNVNGVQTCIATRTANSFGQCPSVGGATANSYDPATKECGYSQNALVAKSGLLADDPDLVSYSDDMNWYELPDEYTPGTFNVVNTYDYSTVDNLDGTSTTTETKTETKTDTAGNSTTTTYVTNTTTNNTTGAVLDRDETITGEVAPEDNPANFPSLTAFSAAPAFSTAAPDASRFADRFTTFKTALEAAPIYAPLNAILSPTLGAGVSSYAVTMGSYGDTSINLADYEGVWDMMKYAILFCSMFVAARLILANK